LYNYPSVAPFDIFCEREENWIEAYVPKDEQVTYDWDKYYILISDSI
jgi:hypothetical protein